jgi:adenine-specific DNA-methyltransferase
MDTPKLRKARGAFFTPPEISRHIASWAIRSSADSVLEPSCGDASFLLEAAYRLRSLGASSDMLTRQLFGVEIHEESVREALTLLQQYQFSATVHTGDFFQERPAELVDAVIGNPPYVRYQQHFGAARAKSLEAALAQGVRLSGLASSWAAFVVHATSFLKPEGRLGLVLPAELLTVKYAAEVRKFLLERFGRVRLVIFENLIFPGVLEEVVLLLAEGSGGAQCFEVHQTRDLSTLRSADTVSWAEHRPREGQKWTPALLSSSLFSTYCEVSEEGSFDTLKDWGQTYLGAVSGANAYFCMTRAEATERQILAADLLRISPPGARQLRGLSLSETAWKSLEREGSRCYLFWPKEEPEASARSYIAEGEKRGVPKAYKCAVRSPWWRVPLVETPDLFLTYMNHDRPRLIANDARVDILNSLYGIALKQDLRRLGRELLPIACLNSMTVLGAEMVGRAYGGGLLKLEPREADALPVPSVSVLQAAKKELINIKPTVGAALRAGDLAKAVALVDAILLTTHSGLTTSDLEALRQGRELLFQRRLSRNKVSRGPN